MRYSVPTSTINEIKAIVTKHIAEKGGEVNKTRILPSGMIGFYLWETFVDSNGEKVDQVNVTFTETKIIYSYIQYRLKANRYTQFDHVLQQFTEAR